MITALGKYLRQLRMSRGELLMDMAGNLNVSSAFLSAVENGKKKMPEKWYGVLKQKYDLSDEQIGELKQAVLESADVLELNIKKASSTSRELAISLARQFDSLDDETSERILEFLRTRKGE